MQALFGLSDADVMAGMNRLEITQEGSVHGIAFSGEKCTLSIVADVSEPDESTTAYDGSIRIVPVGEGEAVAADFTATASHKIYQDEKYLDHDTIAIAFAVENAAEVLAADDPVKGRCVDFKPVAVSFTQDYRNNPYKENGAVQVNYNLDLTLPDASVQVETVLRITTQMKLEALTTAGAENLQTMSEERKDALVQAFLDNATQVMQNLGGAPAEAETAEDAPSDEETPVAEPTTVPPMTE